jgi:cytochrome c peroxidase
VLARLQKRMLESAEGADGVRFISLSFDPGQDTPEVMRKYASRFVDDAFDWRFLTTGGEADLAPILESYGQSIVRDPGTADREAGAISHVLRVYLVDRDLRIRNIYSASYLHADSFQRHSHPAGKRQAGGRAALQGPGDQGGLRAGHRTRRKACNGAGRSADLMAYLEAPPLGLPPIPVPPDNPVTAAKVELGRLLFFDRRLSHNGTFSCAMCHVPEQGFSSNELATAVGIEGRTVRRNSPTIYNVAYLERLFHDGRETTLEQQIWGPLLAHNEMGNPSVGQVIERVRSIPEYQERFARAFDGRAPSMETLGRALASYQRLLVSANSAFDRWYFGEDEQALSAEQKAGFALFSGKAGCSACHLVNQDWALFTDHRMHNTGIGYRRSMTKPPATSRVQIAPGEHIEVRSNIVAEASEPPPNDLGLYEITEDPDDRWKYRTPTLRNVALSAPYMHDGSISTLEGVIDFYDRGGVENELRDPLLRPLGLTGEEARQLVAFLQALTGDNVDTLVADAFAVPVGNRGSP